MKFELVIHDGMYWPIVIAFGTLITLAIVKTLLQIYHQYILRALRIEEKKAEALKKG